MEETCAALSRRQGRIVRMLWHVAALLVTWQELSFHQANTISAQVFKEAGDPHTTSARMQFCSVQHIPSDFEVENLSSVFHAV